MRSKWFAALVTLSLLLSLTVPAWAAGGAGTAGTASSANNANAAAAKPAIAFPVISDIHIQKGDVISERKFAAALKDLYAINPKSDALVINGDLTVTGREEDYLSYQKVLKDNPHPAKVYTTIGNHEFYKAWYDKSGQMNMDTFPNGETEQMSIERFFKYTGNKRLYHDTWIKGYHFIFLGSEKYRQDDPTQGEDAYLSQEQLDWLKKTVAISASNHKPIFIFLHQPLPQTFAATNSESNKRPVVQYKELAEILSPYPQVVFFSGHTHWKLNIENQFIRGKFTMADSSSVRQPYNAEDKPAGTKPSEGLYVEVYKDKVVIKGRDFNKQEWIKEAQYTIQFPIAADPNATVPSYNDTPAEEPRAEAPKELPQPNVLYYDFARSATLDRSPADNQGTAVGHPKVAYDEAFGKNVLVLDGESYINIPDNQTQRVKQVTMEAQFSLATLDGVQDIVAKNQSSDYGLEYNPDTKKLESWIYVKNGETGAYVVVETPELQANKVYHVISAFDGKESVMYLNGKKVGAKKAEGEISQAGDPVDLAIGADPEPERKARSLMKGKIGFVKIYDKALTSIEAEYAYKGLYGAADVIDYDFAVSATEDFSAANNTGTAVGTPKVQYDEAFGKNVLVLDGNSSYINIPDNETQRVKHVTMAAQFSLSTLDAVQDIVAKNQNSDYGLEYNPGTKKLESWIYVKGAGEGAYVVVSTPELKANQVYHVVATFDGKESAIYLNGEKVDSKKAEGDISRAGDPVDLAIGADPEPEHQGRSFLNGKISLVQIYSEAFTQEQVIALYSAHKVKKASK
ncbi:LamG-like jellyroll fold domain-containing protein [Paenibacillus thermotolerans]|uniref:LamG-like jellyroll fold domain-containing protein n=1 Tax=Paenibacillus thermotolerans TaxID=3027807 RepID=UPI0023681FB3|nr:MULTISPECIES: LamG-like jellyroll fold domain-containing protein [unclassified Paenibacillus]